MKKFIRNLILFALSATLLVEALCVIIDPFNVFHPLKIRNNGIEPNKNYIKTTYLLKNPQKFDALLFGSSRVGNIHTENIPDSTCYNMTYSVGLPHEQLENLRTLFSGGVRPEKVFLGVDDVSYKGDPSEHFSEPLRCPYEYLKDNPTEFARLYLNPAYIGSALIENAGAYRPENFRTQFYEYGWNYDYDFAGSQVFSKGSPEEVGAELFGTVFPETEIPSGFESTLQDIADIKTLCEENGAELTIFVNPMLYAQQLDTVYLDFLRRLAEITPFWNFGGYNSLMSDAANYIDESHVNASVSDLIIRCMCCGEQFPGLYERGFGRYTTEENIEEILSLMVGENVIPGPAEPAANEKT